jgi:hypothetical protein
MCFTKWKGIRMIAYQETGVRRHNGIICGGNTLRCAFEILYLVLMSWLADISCLTVILVLLGVALIPPPAPFCSYEISFSFPSFDQNCLMVVNIVTLYNVDLKMHICSFLATFCKKGYYYCNWSIISSISLSCMFVAF